MISFKDIELKDKELITSYTQHSPRRNCDLSFSNLCSWRFLYDTKFAVQDGFLILKFWAGEKLVYMMPVGNGDLKKVLEDMIEDARDVDVDSIMRHIRVLSELSNEMKYATQKRVKAEVAFIKLMKPAMESPKDMQELAGRVNDLENQLSEALSKLQSGAYITKDMLDNMSLQSGGAGALGTGSRNDAVQEEKPVLRRNYDAVTDDIKQIAGQWSQIVASMDDALLMNLLKQADVTVTEDGNSLEIMVKSISGYNVISREETIAKIEELIEERTGISVRVVCTRIDEDEDFNRRYIALEELVGMDIEIDDKEEFI